jgi:hypothetical protein
LSLYAVLFEERLRFDFDLGREYSPRLTEEFDVDEGMRF